MIGFLLVFWATPTWPAATQLLFALAIAG